MAKKAAKAEEQTKFTKYEKARILGSRALQISMGAPYLVKLEKADLERIKYNPLEIAKLEFEAGVIPIGVVRPMPKVEKEAENKEKPEAKGKEEK
jgi:DNA-directed RNA polymerase subunit K/omega